MLEMKKEPATLLPLLIGDPAVGTDSDFSIGKLLVIVKRTSLLTVLLSMPLRP